LLVFALVCWAAAKSYIVIFDRLLTALDDRRRHHFSKPRPLVLSRRPDSTRSKAFMRQLQQRPFVLREMPRSSAR
jgi:hypothetical protein